MTEPRGSWSQASAVRALHRRSIFRRRHTRPRSVRPGPGAPWAVDVANLLVAASGGSRNRLRRQAPHYIGPQVDNIRSASLYEVCPAGPAALLIVDLLPYGSAFQAGVATLRLPNGFRQVPLGAATVIKITTHTVNTTVLWTHSETEYMLPQ